MMAKADGSITVQISKGQWTEALAVLKGDNQEKMRKRQLINFSFRVEMYFKVSWQEAEIWVRMLEFRPEEAIHLM